MQLNVQTPRKFLNPLLSQKSVVSTDVDAFKAALGKYVQEVKQLTASKQSEPNIVAGALMSFLKDVPPFAYKCRPLTHKGQSGIDLAILSGDDVAVIIEAKAVGSKEMITAHNLNRKAFHEAIFYFMQERKKGNDKLKHIVITDFYEWFVFDAQDFDRLFWRNTQLHKKFKAFHDLSLLKKTTTEIYAAIEAELPSMLKDLHTAVRIDCANFNVSAPNSIKDKDLIAIYKLLKPDSLLKDVQNDANSLKPAFYNELLYILGLKEVKDAGKKLIQASGTAGSLYDGIAYKLEQKDAPHEFEDVIKLIIIWINRVLFLKLLESQIKTWTGDPNSRFMNADKISGYGALENLFFDTLAKRIPDRKNKGFDYIPYLNSSLFEMQEEEKAGISISALPDGDPIAYYGKTVVTVHGTKNRKTGKNSTLAYLFEFLDAYNFANDSGEEVVAETKELISASVLGLIFEKINGYKDGSFYTPSFVTMYMARQTIEKAVLQKFNEKHGWTCTALVGDGGLKNELKDYKVSKKDSNALIDSLKICDPAVGSGHFLVSALNEILYVKSVLGLLVDEAGNMLDYNISIENDELIITSDKNDELFEYKKGHAAKTLVQKTLFQEKQKIIENCLFGVDINPNSVNICRLRLWIELLKNAYYQPNGELETLPNIDINIKCGNSLISRFALDTDLKDALKKSDVKIKDYRTAVSDYRKTSDKAEKRKIEALIESIKTNFRTEILYNDPKQRKVVNLSMEIKILEASQSLLGETAKEEKERKQKQTKLKAELSKLSIEIDEIKTNKIYKDAFEWRFEFPEVMNAEGNYIGFDVIIGNPPYGVPIAVDARELIISKLGKVPDYGIQYFFINLAKKLLKPNGIKTFIIPNTLLFNVLTKKYREELLSTWQVNEFLDCTNFDIFDEATVRCIITQFTNLQSTVDVGYRSTENASSFQNLISQPTSLISQSRLLANNQNWGLVFKLKPEILILIEKIRSTGEKLQTLFPDISQGLIAYDSYQGQDAITIKNRVFHSFTPQEGWKKWLWGEDVNSYVVKWNQKEYINYSAAIANPRNPKFFQGSRLLIREISNPKILVGYTKEESYNDPSIINILDTNENFDIKVLLGILNSKLATYYHFNASPKATKGAFPKILVEDIKNFPIPQISNKQQSTLTAKVNAILKAKPKGADTAELEREIDDMVYRLYGLTYDEVKTIEPEYCSLSREEYEASPVVSA